MDWLKKQELGQLSARPTMKRGIVRPTTSKSLGSIQIDGIDMQSSVYNGFNSVFNVVDIFSKKVYSYPCKGQTAANAIAAMETFMRNGMKCTYLAADNGGSFLNEFEEWCRDKGITLVHSKPHSPWSMGKIENMNGQIKKLLFSMMQIKQTRDWVTLMPQVTAMTNQTVTFSTGKSPDDVENDQTLHEEVGNRIQNTANKKYKGKGNPSQPLQPKDYVRLLLDYDEHKIRKGSKEGYYRKEIYQIVKVVKNRKIANVTDSYKIRNVETDEIMQGLYGCWQLLHIPPPEEMEKMPEIERRPPPIEGTRDTYEVESILDKRTYRGVTKYKVLWKGWPRKDATWETRTNL